MPQRTNYGTAPTPIEFTLQDGRTLKGSYRLKGRIVTATGPHGTKSTQAGANDAETVARMLLTEMAAIAAK